MKKVITFLIVLAFLSILVPSLRAQPAGSGEPGRPPTDRTFARGEKIMGYDAPPPGPPTEKDLRRERAAVQYPGNASLDYRGVVFDNFNPGGAYGEEIAVSFTSAGIWVRDNIWHQISSLTPFWMISGSIDADTSDAELIASFPLCGVWIWQHTGYPGTWTQISGSDSDGGGFVVNDDSDASQELYVDFASAGLWRYEFHNTPNWRQMSNLDMKTGLRMNTLAAAVEEACAIFPTQGVWRLWLSGTTPRIDQLTGTTTDQDDHVSAKFTGGAAEDLVIDFGSLGLWLCEEDTQEWHQIDTNTVEAVRAVNFGGDATVELMIRHPFSSGQTGLWMWNYGAWPGLLTKLHDWTPDYHGFVEPLDIDGDTETNGDQEMAVDFGLNGLWIYDNTDQSWTQITTADPMFMVAGDYYNDGYDATLVAGFQTYGLWRYHATNKTWSQLSSILPASGG